MAIHGGGTTAMYFDCPGHPSYSLLRSGTAAGFTVVALDRPGYGSSAPYPEAMVLRRAARQPGLRCCRSHPRRTTARRRGIRVGPFGRLRADVTDGRRPARCRPARHRTRGHGTALPPRGQGNTENGHPRTPPVGNARIAVEPRGGSIRPRSSAAPRFRHRPRLTRTRWCRTGRERLSRSSRPPCGSPCTSASPSTKRSGKPTMRR